MDDGRDLGRPQHVHARWPGRAPELPDARVRAISDGRGSAGSGDPQLGVGRWASRCPTDTSMRLPFFTSYPESLHPQSLPVLSGALLAKGSTQMILWTLLGLLAVVVLTFALIGFLYMTRGVHVRRVRSAASPDGVPPIAHPFFCDSVTLL